MAVLPQRTVYVGQLPRRSTSLRSTVGHGRAADAGRIAHEVPGRPARALQPGRSVRGVRDGRIPTFHEGASRVQRSNEHLQLFDEGREAEFFGSDDELLDNVRYHGERSDERARIAAAGRQRGLRDGYDNRSVMREMLSRSLEV